MEKKESKINCIAKGRYQQKNLTKFYRSNIIYLVLNIFSIIKIIAIVSKFQKNIMIFQMPTSEPGGMYVNNNIMWVNGNKFRLFILNLILIFYF